MSKMIQIRDIPDHVYDRLKVHAAEEGRSLSSLLLREAVRIADKPSQAELFERLSKLPPLKLSESAADAIRAGHEERDRAIDHAVRGASA